MSGQGVHGKKVVTGDGVPDSRDFRDVRYISCAYADGFRFQELFVYLNGVGAGKLGSAVDDVDTVRLIAFFRPTAHRGHKGTFEGVQLGPVDDWSPCDPFSLQVSGRFNRLGA